MSHPKAEPASLGLRVMWWIPYMVAVVTILLTPWPPMLDWPLHIAQGTLLGHWSDPSFVTSGIYCRAPFTGYHVFHYITGWLKPWVGPDWISRTMVLLLYVFYTGAVTFLLKAFRGERRWVVIATPFFFGFSYVMGFGPFLLGSCCFFVCMGVAEYFSHHPKKSFAALLMGCLFVTYLCHPLAFYVALLALGVRWCVHWVWSAALRWISVWVLLPPGLWGLYSVFFHVSTAGRDAQWWKAVRATATAVNWNVPEPSLWVKIGRLPLYAVGSDALAWHDALLGWCLVASIVALAVLAWQKNRTTQESEESKYELSEREKKLHRRGRWSLVWTALALYLGFQMTVGHIAFIFPRFAFFFVVLLLVQISRVHHSLFSRLLGLAWGLSLIFGINNGMYHIDWAESMKGLRQIVKKIPQNSRVLGLLTHRKHAPAIVQIYRGGEARTTFSYLAGMPVRDCSVLRQLNTWELSQDPSVFKPKKHPHWDFLLLYIQGGKKKMIQRFPWLFQKNGLYIPSYKAGRWLLVRRRRSIR